MNVSPEFKEATRKELKRLKGQRSLEANPAKGSVVRSLNELKQTKSSLMSALGDVDTRHPASQGLEKGIRSLIQAIALIETAVRKL